MSHLRSALTALVVAALAGPALAASNLSFETGKLTGWDVYGHAQAVDDSLGVNPTHGKYQAKILSSIPSDPPSPGLLPEDLASATGIDIEVINEWAAYPEGFLEPFTPDMLPVHGSAIAQHVSLGAGAWISFDYHFLTNEGGPSQNHNDFSFAALLGPDGGLVDGFVLANTWDTEVDGAASTPYAGLLPPPGYRSAQLFAGGLSGTHRLVFGVMDAHKDGEEASGESVLLIDNVHVVPLPAAVWPGLALLGAIIVPAAWRRRRSAATHRAAPLR